MPEVIKVTLVNRVPNAVTINTTYIPPTWGSISGSILNQTDLQSELGNKEDVSNKSTSITLGNSDILYPTQNAVKTYVDTEIGNIPEPTTPTLDSVTSQGNTTSNAINVGGLTASSLVYPSTDGTIGQIIQTDGAGNLSFVDLPNDASWGNIIGTLSDQTDLQSELNSKENVSNKSTSTSLGTSNTLYPSQNAVKSYVDNAVSNLSNKEDVSNKSTDVTMGGASPSSVLYTSQYAVATYVQNEIAQAQAGIPTFEIDMFANYKVHETDEDGTTTYVGKIKATNGNWLVERYVDNGGDITATYANASNNASYTTLASAWAVHTTLTYTTIDNLTSI